MTNITLLLYILLSLLAILLLMESYSLIRLHEISLKKRRRLMRIKVPKDKAITCRILEPLKDARMSEFIVDDITMAGISFFADRKIDKQIVKLSIRFPFTTYKDAAAVWGRVAYSTKCADSEMYRTGIAYMRNMRTKPSGEPRQTGAVKQ